MRAILPKPLSLSPWTLFYIHTLLHVYIQRHVVEWYGSFSGRLFTTGFCNKSLCIQVCNYVLKKYASCDAKTDRKMLACIKPSIWQRLSEDHNNQLRVLNKMHLSDIIHVLPLLEQGKGRSILLQSHWEGGWLKSIHVLVLKLSKGTARIFLNKGEGA